MSDFGMKRLGLLMAPEPGNRQEAGETLNPAATRGPIGQPYLFPLVAHGNDSRIDIARVRFKFESYQGVDFVNVANKDASVIPVAIRRSIGP